MALVGPLATQQFGRQVAGSASDHSRARERVLRLVKAGQAEVHNGHIEPLPILFQHHVVRLQVAMDDAGSMQSSDSRDQLTADLRRLVGGHGP